MDETTARRLVVWIRFFDVARKVLLKEDVFILLKVIIEQADLLATDSFYATNTNHGMFQDESMLVFTEYFDKLLIA